MLRRLRSKLGRRLADAITLVVIALLCLAWWVWTLTLGKDDQDFFDGLPPARKT